MNVENMLRIGKVSSVNPADKTAKVIFPDLEDMVSGELHVIQHGGALVGVASAGKETHTHNASVTIWMPKVDENVLCIYSPIKDSDGYILGVV